LWETLQIINGLDKQIDMNLRNVGNDCRLGRTQCVGPRTAEQNISAMRRIVRVVAGGVRPSDSNGQG
jgi:hypothetical protein